jgi:hypothetical protein
MEFKAHIINTQTGEIVAKYRHEMIVNKNDYVELNNDRITVYSALDIIAVYPFPNFYFEIVALSEPES